MTILIDGYHINAFPGEFLTERLMKEKYTVDMWLSGILRDFGSLNKNNYIYMSLNDGII